MTEIFVSKQNIEAITRIGDGVLKSVFPESAGAIAAGHAEIIPLSYENPVEWVVLTPLGLKLRGMIVNMWEVAPTLPLDSFNYDAEKMAEYLVSQDPDWEAMRRARVQWDLRHSQD